MFENWGLLTLTFSLTGEISPLPCGNCVHSNARAGPRSNADADDKRRFYSDNIILSAIIGILPFWNVVAAVTALAFIRAFAIINPGNRKFLRHALYRRDCVYFTCLGFTVQIRRVVLSNTPGSISGTERRRVGIRYPVYYFRVLGIKFLLIIFSFCCKQAEEIRLHCFPDTFHGG